LLDEPITLEQLSEEFSISRERVRQIEVRAFEKVQAAVKASIVRDVIAAKAAQKKAELDGSKFFPIYPSLKEMMDSLQKLAVAEKARLLELKTKLRGGK
jgi:acetyl-CoA acetyltransferase